MQLHLYSVCASSIYPFVPVKLFVPVAKGAGETELFKERQEFGLQDPFAEARWKPRDQRVFTQSGEHGVFSFEAGLPPQTCSRELLSQLTDQGAGVAAESSGANPEVRTSDESGTGARTVNREANPRPIASALVDRGRHAQTPARFLIESAA